jgi:hypothetical protein
MSNKDKLKTLDNLLLARLEVLFEDANEYFKTSNMVLDTNLAGLYHAGLNQFYQSLESSLLDIDFNIRKGLPADPNSINEFNSFIEKQLQIIFKEIGVLDRIIASSFNSIIVEKEEVLQTSKRIANKIGDYLLYADPSLGTGYFWGDSFNTTDKIDNNSILIEGDSCYHSVEDGAILLPLNGEPEKPEIKSITINKSSNGNIGNNQELNKTKHKDIEVIGDGNPDTWFEYEIVSNTDIKTSLVLDLTIALKEISVINHIHINPINFGTPTSLEIDTFETSKDGKTFISIKDEIPIKDFVPEDEENRFQLSASTSNYSGQGFYSFLARKAQYVHVVLKQSTPYTIQTLNGTKLRYAIGLRDINIYGRKFKESGSIISTEFSSTDSIRKLSLYAVENPIEKSSLADIDHFVSHDDSATWLQIQPQDRDSSDIPEVINFNTIDNNSVTTSKKVTSLRHKISLSRNKDAFSGDAIVKKEKTDKLEILSLPSIGNLDIILGQTPIESSIQLVMPYMGSFSCPNDNAGSDIKDASPPMDLDFVEFTIDAPEQNILKYNLPFKKIDNLEQKIRVFVNGSQIEYMAKSESHFASGTGTSYSLIDEDSKIYFLNKGGRELQFGHIDFTGTQRGFVPTSGTKIKVCLDGDSPYLELTDNGYELVLSCESDGSKENTSIVAFESIRENNTFQYEIEIPQGSTSYKSKLTEYSIGEYLEIENSSDELSKYKSTSTSQTFDSINNGLALPVFLTGTSNFEIKEYDSDGTLITGSDRQFQTKVAFIDGNKELESSPGTLDENTYTFDPSTGSIYLGSSVPSDRKTVLICYRVKVNNIFPDRWNFKQDISTNKTDTQKIILDPKEVYTTKLTYMYTLVENTTSVQLITRRKKFNWFNSELVRNTVKPSSDLFSINAKPTEVKYIDGKSEFSNIISITEEPITFTSIGGGLWEFTLLKTSESQTLVGSPTFSIVRSTTTTVSPSNEFNINGQKDSFATLTSSGLEGDWAVETSSGTTTIRLKLSSTPEAHSVSYRCLKSDTGVDKDSLYSIDYKNATIHFAVPLTSNGTISFEVSNYSAFYNIGKTISSKNIDSIDKNTIKFKPSFLVKFLKQDTIQKSRPQIVKVLYSYYKTTTESLADLEPYFSPICKDVAFKAITSNLLENL